MAIFFTLEGNGCRKKVRQLKISQDLRDSGNYYDCSSLAFYSWQNGGVNISYGGATSAAAEAQGLYEANKMVSFEQMQPGDLIFYSTS